MNTLITPDFLNLYRLTHRVYIQTDIQVGRVQDGLLVLTRDMKKDIARGIPMHLKVRQVIVRLFTTVMNSEAANLFINIIQQPVEAGARQVSLLAEANNYTGINRRRTA